MKKIISATTLILLAAICFAQTDSLNVEQLVVPKQFGVERKTLMAFLLAQGLLIAGFYLPSAFAYLQKGRFEKTFTKQRLIVTYSIMVALAGLLVFVPDTAETLKMVIGLDANIENGVGAFLFIGFTLYKFLANPSKVEPQEEETKTPN